ncbi:unnamed protein product [Staurois parvus]|uniref:Uncharacterized protein n=1 Tax=Staurois parvus TaxID=386267 RepID=A0ABN9BFY7_9NEOB|nr:unnamed protein product [Staurois parvus]
MTNVPIYLKPLLEL